MPFAENDMDEMPRLTMTCRLRPRWSIVPVMLQEMVARVSRSSALVMCATFRHPCATSATVLPPTGEIVVRPSGTLTRPCLFGSVEFLQGSPSVAAVIKRDIKLLKNSRTPAYRGTNLKTPASPKGSVPNLAHQRLVVCLARSRC